MPSKVTTDGAALSISHPTSDSAVTESLHQQNFESQGAHFPRTETIQ
jgi:hypothetical protein